MGHKDLTMIARVYGRWIKDAMPEAGSKAVAMFSNHAESIDKDLADKKRAIFFKTTR